MNMNYDNQSPEARKIIALASQESENLKHFYLGVEHIFIALTKVENGVTQSVLQQVGLDPKQFRDAIRQFVGIGDGHSYWSGIRVTPRCENILKLAAIDASGKANKLIEEKELLICILLEEWSIPARMLQKMGISTPEMVEFADEVKIPVASINIPRVSDTRLLDQFGKDITQLAGEGRIDPIIGRRNEILQLVRVLTRKNKNNPMLIGEAGVGKTAVVEGLALRIAEGKVTSSLRDKRIIELSLATIVAGTKYRGEFEERVVGIVNECKDHPEVIVFIDEIHTVVGGGAAEGGIDASNILKPALARGEMKCIGATTISEFRKHIEKDPALERRFQSIIVHEPSIEDTFEILSKLKERYEEHHKVRIEDAAIIAAVNLTAKFVPDRRLPDKALDVLDEACTSVLNPSISMYGEMESQIIAMSEVTAESIAEVISRWTGIPVGQLTVEEREQLMHMAEIVNRQVIGQNEAVEKVTDVIKMARAGLKDPQHPAGVFLFLGPTGVGKTELARATARFLFGSDNEIIRLDMSEYMEKHSVSKLIGAPPGYVGHEEEGQLTGRLRRKPYSVVLLDEVEKAHPDIFDIFLQVFDEGRLTDSKGRTIDAKNALFIMTSNIGNDVFKKAQLGFSVSVDRKEHVARESMVAELSKVFRQEFLNRLDEVVLFRHLSREDIAQIALNFLSTLRSKMNSKGILLEVEEEAMALICSEGYDPINGARPLARTIERLVTKPLSEQIIAGEFNSGDRIVVRVKENRLQFTIAEEE